MAEEPCEESREMPDEVSAFLLVGRIVKRETDDGRQEGVVKHVTTKWGVGSAHAGLPCHYPKRPQAPSGCKPSSMPVQLEYEVRWDGQEEPEQLSLEEVWGVVTARVTEEPWLPAGISKAMEAQWRNFPPRNIHDFMDAAVKEAQAAQEEAERAAARGAGKGARAGAARPKPAAGGGGAAAAAGKKKAGKQEAAALRAPVDLTSKLAAKYSKKRKCAGAAPTASPAPKRASLSGATGPATVAAAAARLQPSGGQGSPDGAAASNPVQRRLAEQQRGASQASLEATSSYRRQQQQQQQRGDGSKGKATAANGGKAAKAAPASAAKAAPASGSKPVAAPKPAPSKGKRPASSIPAVLQQHEQAAVAPRESGMILEEALKLEEFPLKKGGAEEAAWYDSVEASDGILHRVYSRHVIVPEGKCLAPKDRPLSQWKLKPSAGADYAVDEVLAEEEGEEGGTRYLVKWHGYEVDPGQGGWLEEDAMGDCQEVLAAWQRKGRAAWHAACQALREEAGVEAGA